MITSDNFLLSELSSDGRIASACELDSARGKGKSGAIDCNGLAPELDEINCTGGLSVLEYIESAISENTRRAYTSDLKDFNSWGGTIPASPQTLARYLAERAASLSVVTLKRRLAAISVAHQMGGYESPSGHPLVYRTLRGIARWHGSAQRRVRPILKEDLFAMLDKTPTSINGMRDRALLLVGFAAALRRSELVGLDIENVGCVDRGLIVTVVKSKTDPLASGRQIAIPKGSDRWCPVAELQAWLSAMGTHSGPIFRPISRAGKVGNRRLSDRGAAEIIKRYAASIGMRPEEVSGHSLRSGFVTSAAQVGVPAWQIQAQTGHASVSVLSRYIRQADLFRNNPVSAVV